MAATGSQNGTTTRRVYLNGAGQDVTTWAGKSAMADWALIEGAGTTVLQDEGGVTAAYPTDSTVPIRMLPGPWSAFISTTSLRCIMGNGDVPSVSPPASNANLNGMTIPPSGSAAVGNTLYNSSTGALAYGPVNLSGGANYVTGTPPKWATTSAQTTAFSAAIDSFNYLTVTSAVVAQLPALTGANEGRIVSFFNNGTSTAVITPTGTDLLAVSGGAGATAATAAGPTGGNAATYVAMTALGKWVKWQ